MTATLIHPDTAEQVIADILPLPLGEGRGEGHRSRADSHPPRPPVSHPEPETRDPEPAPRGLLNRLLTLYTTHSNSFNDLCRELNLSMLELLDLLEHPEVTRALERLAQASETRAKLLARITNDAAVSALIDLIDTTDKPETRRKAAGAILRHGKPPAKSSECGNTNRATDSDAVAAEKSVPPPQEPGGDTVEEALRLDRVVESPAPHTGDGGTVTRATQPLAPDIRAAGFNPRSRTEPKRLQAA